MRTWCLCLWFFLFRCSNTDTKSSLGCSAVSSEDYMRTWCLCLWFLLFLCSNTDTKSSLSCSAASSNDFMRTECDISVSRLLPIHLGSQCWYQKNCLKKESFSIWKFGFSKKKVANRYQKISCPKKSRYQYWSKRMNDKKKKRTDKDIMDFDIHDVFVCALFSSCLKDINALNKTLSPRCHPPSTFWASLSSGRNCSHPLWLRFHLPCIIDWCKWISKPNFVTFDIDYRGDLKYVLQRTEALWIQFCITDLSMQCIVMCGEVFSILIMLILPFWYFSKVVIFLDRGIFITSLNFDWHDPTKKKICL